jgi:hypothetical protein
VIFMSQSGITDPAQETGWDAWYIEHLKLMASVPGIDSAQRFKGSTAAYSPSLAMYSVRSAAVFQDPYYLSVRGMGEWLPLIDRRYYLRNLFDGSELAPHVKESEVLLVADRDEPERTRRDAIWTWLECVGIDRSTRWRGIAVADACAGFADDVAVYRPVTRRYDAADL